MKFLLWLPALMLGLKSMGQARLVPAFPALPPLEKPVLLVCTPAPPGLWLVGEQRGLIYALEDKAGVSNRSVWLNLTREVSQTGWETGLLGLAFHPRFAENRLIYLSLTRGEGRDLVSRIVEMEVSDLKNGTPRPGRTRVLVEVPQPYENHNGGAIVFGPDGYLYFSLGDGGSANDPHNYSQRKDNWYGKVFRIDVDRREEGKPYGIPPGNPFRHEKGSLPEIFAWGLRNVWQMQFDTRKGTLWAGDVGQNDREEIDTLAAGKNYGWRVWEGKNKVRKNERAEGATPPVLEYSQKNGDKSVTGGLVYRGSRYSQWDGWYLYGDFMTGRIWGYDVKNAKNHLLADRRKVPLQVSCFALSPSGEVLLCDYNEGVIYSLQP